MKEIGCTFTMGGTYHLDEKSVYAARLKAMGDLPLPEDRDYISDSFTVDDLSECMVANGWDEDEVNALSRFTPETLTAEIGRRCELGIEEDDEREFTTIRLKEFLLDYYGIEYAPSIPSSNPQPPAQEKAVTEMCLHCMNEVTMRWDTATMGFKAFCPVCGNPLVLCDECHQSGAPCDYDSEEGSCRLNPSTLASMEIPPALRVETPLGAIIVRTDMDGDGVWIDLRRPDTDDDMNMVHVGFSPKTKDEDAHVEVSVNGEGRKNGESERVVLDGVEDYFRTE